MFNWVTDWVEEWRQLIEKKEPMRTITSHRKFLFSIFRVFFLFFSSWEQRCTTNSYDGGWNLLDLHTLVLSEMESYEQHSLEHICPTGGNWILLVMQFQIKNWKQAKSCAYRFEPLLNIHKFYWSCIKKKDFKTAIKL